MVSYRIPFSETLEADFNALAEKLNTSKEAVFCKAIALLKHAAAADKVVLVTDGVEQEVRLK